MSRKSEAAAKPAAKPAAHASAAGHRKTPARQNERRLLLWASLVFLFVVCVVFRAIVFGGLTFVSPDATAPLGFVRVGEQALKAGTYPLWNPYVFAGMPSFASGAYNPLIYPPDWPVAIVQKVLPMLPGLSWMLLYYFLAGLGTYLLARHWGATPLGAIVAGIAFMATPNLVANGAHGHGSQMVNEAYLPWLLLLASRVWRNGRWSDTATLALLVGFQLLRGHVQIAYYGWLMIGLYSLFEVGRRIAQPDGARQVGGRALQIVVALVLGFALSAFFSLPIREYAQYSIRASGAGGGVTYQYATGWSLGPIEALTFLVPGALGFGGATYWGSMPFTDFPNYMGLAVLLCAFLAIAAGQRRFEVAFLLVLAVFALLVSFGRHSALYNFLFEHLPYFNKFRVPVMILILTQLAVAVLAGLGLTAVAEAAADPARRTRMLRWTGALLALVALLFLSGVMGDAWREAYAAAARASRPGMPAGAIDAGYAAMAKDLVRVSLLALVAMAALFAALKSWIKPGIAIGIVAAATLFDLVPIDSRLMANVLGPPSVFTAAGERDEIIDYLLTRKKEGEFRIFPVREFQSNRYAGFALASMGGYHAAKPKLYQTFLDADSSRAMRSPAAWRLLNVRFVIVPGLLPPSPALTEVFRGQQEVVYQYNDALPRATLVAAYRVVPHDQQLALFSDPLSDPGQVTLLSEEPGVKPVPGGTVTIDEYGLNRVRLTTNTPGPSILRLADLAFPGWQVTIDGRPATSLVADYLTRAVAVPAGRHAVTWEYHDTALERGLWISIGAFLLILALYLVPRFQRKRARAA